MEALTWDLILKSNQQHLSCRAVYYLYDMQIMYKIFNFYNARTVRNFLLTGRKLTLKTTKWKEWEEREQDKEN